MNVVIDGYNLLHAMGILVGKVGPRGLEQARHRLLGTLHGVYGDQSHTVTVVFDSGGVPPDAAEIQHYEGIRVHYAIRHPQADDVIEELVHHHSSPRQLLVVSDDHRVQQAGRKRHCAVRGCHDYVEDLERMRRQRKRASTPQAEKQELMSEREKEKWLAAFGDIDNDPDLE